MEEEILNEKQKEALDTDNVEAKNADIEKTEASEAEQELKEPSKPDEQKTTLPAPKTESSDKLDSLDAEIKRLKRELDEERKKRIEGESRLYCMEALEKRGLPRSLCEFLTAQSNDETDKRVERVAEIIKSSVNEEISKRLQGVPQPSKSAPVMSKSAFKNLSLDEMQRLYKTDKTLYMSLAKK
ncbi:MAG: hypothetical protein J6B60_03210 [Clostridia bacterium]|nr:hypothetical protein [Clostridia bacterium]MBO5416046.1 hypothetical protein [Clostridia bacterium]